MSDLISRSELLKEIEKYKFGAISNDAEREYIKKTILDFIICQPTAYSVDKVVENIMEAYGCHNCEQADTMACNECAELEVLNDICEIVKQGGMEYAITFNELDCSKHDKEIYNKAIDDFSEKIKSNDRLGYVGCLDKIVDEIAEQLKAGGENE